MAQVRINGVRISGVITVVPSGIRYIDDEAQKFSLNSSKIKRLKRDIGLNSRYITEKEECTSDLCEYAAKVLLSNLNYNPETIDALILITQTPDYFQPATSFVLHSKLGLTKNCVVFDVNLGCSGYVYGLWLSSLMITTSSCRRVLMLAGDTISRCVSPYDGAVAPLFGDAGSATMIEKASQKDEMTFVLHSDGNGFKHLIIPAGAFRKRPSESTQRLINQSNGSIKSEEYLYMNGAEIFTFSIREVPPLIEEVLKASGWKKEEVEYFILHQANKFIIENIAKRIKVEKIKVPFNVFSKYGNQSCASIPATICENLHSLLEHRTLKTVMAGFGAGLSWAACAVSLGPIKCNPVIVRN